MRSLRAGLGAAATLAVVGCASTSSSPLKAPAGPTSPPPVCIDFSFPIYFESSSDQLTPAARQVLTDAAQRVRGCTLGRLDVVGLADATGSARANLAISRRRAASVVQALAAAGLPRPNFDIEAAGASGAVTQTGQPEPLRRRTEVVIRASPPASKPAG